MPTQAKNAREAMLGEDLEPDAMNRPGASAPGKNRSTTVCEYGANNPPPINGRVLAINKATFHISIPTSLIRQPGNPESNAFGPTQLLA